MSSAMPASDPEAASELLRNTLRCFAGAMVGMGVFTLLSGGVNVLSSLLVVALGVVWLRALRSRGSLADALDELAKLSDKDCRGCCRNCCSGACRGALDNVRGLAIAVICFGVFELIIYLTALPLIVSILAENGVEEDMDREYSCSYFNDNPYVGTEQYSCFTGQSTYCTIFYNPAFWQEIQIPCYVGTTDAYCYLTLPSTASISGTCTAYAYMFGDSNPIDFTSGWLLYATGVTAVTAPLNIAWGAITLSMLAVLTLSTREKLSARASDAVPLMHSELMLQTYAPPPYDKQPEPIFMSFAVGADKSGAEEDVPEA